MTNCKLPKSQFEGQPNAPPSNISEKKIEGQLTQRKKIIGPLTVCMQMYVVRDSYAFAKKFRKMNRSVKTTIYLLNPKLHKTSNFICEYYQFMI